MRPSVPISQCQDVSFPDSPRVQGISKEYLAKTLETELMQSRQVFSSRRMILFYRSKRTNRAITWNSEPPFIGCLPTRQEILNVSHIADMHSMESAHHFSSRPDCNNTADVPSLILRTALSAITLVSDLRGDDAE